ncbi:hypothetical protein RMS29_006720 [Agrobacterium rosae]|uniref:Uncharacterized protein n=1 Tax=Agrobacterium rosae TaxID=1972867 RepID=A0AAE5RX06_9HYPH|nr:hypothetical protein [Agrobacterium rosae]KAA3509916.1 hypothetical protein DXM21_18785 [Agrobacterium rosae]KAA3515135.1 hypothetical protein DXM25_21585 [Agrobacterium rosae]MCM2433120.1 hypothetical protein [Agrobacterium rosae]MDX8331451.1 hypothetical protein [Agrobacterium rosae]MQB50505.1 hypothetical protein [Agrobacterium rosae]
MKAVLIIAAMVGISASAAFADPIVQPSINTSIPVDREFKTASIAMPTEQAQKPVLVLKKTNRLPGNTETATASPQSALARMQ